MSKDDVKKTETEVSVDETGSFIDADAIDEQEKVRDIGVKKDKLIAIEDQDVKAYIDIDNLSINLVELKGQKKATDSDERMTILQSGGKDFESKISFGSFNSDMKRDKNLTLEEQGKDFLVLKDSFGRIKISLQGKYLMQVEFLDKETGFIGYVSIWDEFTKGNKREDSVIYYINERAKEIPKAKMKKAKGEIFRSKFFSYHNWISDQSQYWSKVIISKSMTKGVIEKKNFKNHDYIRSSLFSDKHEKDANFLIFIGPKDYSLISDVESDFGIKNFKAIINFGKLQFISEPIYKLLELINSFCNNYGLSIIILTIVIRILMLPLFSSSMKAMEKMRKIAPEIKKIKEKYGKDTARVNKETVELYKRHSVNPLASIWPLLIQIPLFFSLFKVISVSYGIRQSGFLFWQDISMQDNHYITNMFGALPFEGPSFIMIGVLPVIMGLTIYFQQKTSPTSSSMSSDQEAVMKFMPLILVFAMSGFPVALLIYWITSNLFTISQQVYSSIKNSDKK